VAEVDRRGRRARRDRLGRERGELVGADLPHELGQQRRELWLEHTLLGDALDPEELQLAVDTVARIADGEDDALGAAFGGLRYADLSA